MGRHSKHSVTRCNVKNCRSSSRDWDTSLFHIPRSKDVCMEWIRLSGEDKLLHSAPDFVLNHLHICEKHFHPTEIVLESDGNAGKRLKTGSIPTIFHPLHQPIPNPALREWLSQYPESDLKAPVDFKDEPHTFGGNCSSESAPQQTEQVWDKDSSIQGSSTIKEEPQSSDQEDESPSMLDHGIEPSVPVMQMLLNAHLARRSTDSERHEAKELLGPVINPQINAADGSRRVFFLQVEKLPKKSAPSQSMPPDSSSNPIKSTPPVSPSIQNVVIKKEIIEPEVPKDDLIQNIHEPSIAGLQNIPRISSKFVKMFPKRSQEGVHRHAPTEAVGQKVMLLQVEKLPKRKTHVLAHPRQNEQCSTSAVPADKTSKTQLFFSGNNHQLEKTQKQHDAVSLSTATKPIQSPAAQPTIGLVPTAQLLKRGSKDGMERVSTNFLLPEAPVLPNQPGSGRRVIFLQVEKLPKSSTNNSAIHDHFKENKAPSVQNCAEIKQNCDIEVQSDETKTSPFPAVWHKDVQADAAVQSVSPIPHCDASESHSKNDAKNFTTGTKEFQVTRTSSKLKKLQNPPPVHLKKKPAHARKIKRLQKRVECLEKMLHKLVDEELVSPPVLKAIKRTLEGKSKGKRRR